MEINGYKELRDGAFLAGLNLEKHKSALAEFWPGRGPRWDALGLADGSPVLVEAKARTGELRSASAAGETSMVRIASALDTARRALGARGGRDWSRGYYQYANRIAHLWWLRDRGVDAHLLLVGFLGDKDVRGPTHADAWSAAYKRMDEALGLPEDHALSPYIHHVTLEVTDLT